MVNKNMLGTRGRPKRIYYGGFPSFCSISTHQHFFQPNFDYIKNTVNARK